MAESKPIKYSQIAEPNLLNPLKKEIEGVNKLLSLTENNLKQVIEEANKIAQSTPLDSFKNLEKVEKGIKDATTAVKELDQVEKERVKLQARLDTLEDDRIKNNFELKEQIRLQSKELRDNAKAAAQAGNAYEVLKQKTNEAQLEAKRLAAEFGENSKEAREAIVEFERYDDQLSRINKTMRDGRRDVGRYEIGFKEAKEELKKSRLELKKITKQFGENSKEAKEARQEFNRLERNVSDLGDKLDELKSSTEETNTSINKLTRSFKIFASATIVLKVLELVQSSLAKNSDATAEFEKLFVKLTTSIEVLSRRIGVVIPVLTAKLDRFFLAFKIGMAKLTDLFGQNEKDISKLEEEYDALAEIAGKDLSDAFSGMGDEIADLTSKKVALIDDTLKYRKEIVDLQKDIANLIPTQEKLRAAFEDDSKSLSEQIEAGVAYREVLQKRFDLEAKIAAKNLKLAQDNAKANSISVEAQEELSQATIDYNQLIADQASELVSTNREIQKLRDDQTQLNLDFYIDDFDNKKTVNERIIADETQTYKHRQELLRENFRVTEKVFQLEANALNKSLEQRGKAQLNFDELVQNSAKQNAEIIEKSGISEPLAIRVLEVIRERRTFLQDNAEAQRDLNLAAEDSRDIQSDIILQQKAINQLDKEGVDLELVLNELTSNRLQNEIDNLKERLNVAKQGSTSFLAIQQELNEKLLEQEQNRLNKEKELRDKNIDSIKQGFDLIGDLAAKRSEARVQAIDKELAAEEQRVNQLQELAAEGNEDALNNLAITEQRRRELELQRQQQIQRQERAELALTAIQTYSGKVQAGEPNPLASTIADISVLRAFIQALPGFFEGSERVGDDLNPLLPGRDGHIIRVDGTERIIPGAENRLIGRMSNTELALMANREHARQKDYANFMPLIKELKTLTKITHEKPTYLGIDYDKISDSIIRRVQRGQNLEKVHKKNGGIWG